MILLLLFIPLIIIIFPLASLESVDGLSGLAAVLIPLRKEVLHVITGNLLGDGCLRQAGSKVNGLPSGNSRFEMTKDLYSYDQLLDVFTRFYAELSGSGLRPYPNILLPQHVGKVVSQYHFCTLSNPALSALQAIWYRWDVSLHKYVKIVPANIATMFSAISLAHWLMDDGYYTDKTVIFCTDSFTIADCKILQSLLLTYGIHSGLIYHKGNPRIRIFRGSMPVLAKLVTPFLHPDFMYKLGE